ncbi:MAG TPA: S8 family peptidase [Kofleriaceae bacterium]
MSLVVTARRRARLEGREAMRNSDDGKAAVATRYIYRVIVKFRDFVELPYDESAEQQLTRLNIGPWDRITAAVPGARLTPLFTTVSPEQIRELVGRAVQLDRCYRPPNFLTYFAVEYPAGADPEQLAKLLRSWRLVEFAYPDAGPTPPPVNASDDPRSINQDYLDAAPGGIDARYAWGLPGGDGTGIGIVDIEQGWTLNHEDLAAAGITLISGVNQAYFGHGTSVLGELRAVDNTTGDVGIAPVASVRVNSQYRTAANYNTADVILNAVTTMAYGDVMLLEAQTTIAGSYLPVEVELAPFDAIRLATALGITVIEAGGNGSQNLDNFTDGGGNHVLRRGDPAFKDSGAIMVGAASSSAPHARLGFSNYGSRIDCYAWGENIDTTGDGWMGNLTTTYTTSFGGTSGASPIIAGAAALVQGLAQAALAYRFSPGALRVILSSPTTGTASATPATDLIGVMPDLRAIITGNELNLAPDVYMRDFVGDAGDPHTAAVSASPDIIVRNSPVANPQASFGAGSGTENSNTLSDDVEQGQDNFVYVRVLNRGGSPATAVSATVYWSPPATLVTPDLWSLVGSVTIPNVPTGNLLTVSNAITWPAAAVPSPGHYCFVGIVSSARDPGPSPGDLLVWDNFVRFVRANNNVTWRNFNVVNNVPPPGAPPPGLPPIGWIRLPFLFPGAPDLPREMALEIVARLPDRAMVYFEAPLWLLDRLSHCVPRVTVDPLVTIDPRAGMGRLRIRPHGVQALGAAVLAAKSRTACALYVHIDPMDREHVFQIAARQLWANQEVGRITWLLSPLKHDR